MCDFILKKRFCDSLGHTQRSNGLVNLTRQIKLLKLVKLVAQNGQTIGQS